MSVQNKPIQVQPNLHAPVQPAAPAPVAPADALPPVSAVKFVEPLMTGPAATGSTIRAKEDRARFEFDDEERKVWIYITRTAGEELVCWAPYSAVLNVFYGARRVRPNA